MATMYPLTLETFPPEVISDMVAYTSDQVADASKAIEVTPTDIRDFVELLDAVAQWEEWAV
jgi:hypothetical protein